MIFRLLLVFLALSAGYCSPKSNDSPGGSIKSERDLRRDLFQDYDKNTRPVLNPTTTVPVEISMSPLRIKSMAEKDQLLSLETWVKMAWTDEFLKWDPAEYSNITVIRVSPSQVWKPDVAVYTASPMESMFPTVQTQTLVYNNGHVLWVPPFAINSRCPIPFRNYITSDRSFVECNIRMGSWTFSGKELDLQLTSDQVDLTNFQDYNHEWKLVKIVSSRDPKRYPCCPDDIYPLINFNVTLKRRNYYLNSGSAN